MTHKLHMAAIGLLIAGLVPVMHAQVRDDMHDRARRLTERTTNDLQRVADHGNLNNDQRGRLDAAMRELRDFRRDVDNGHYDRDRLDHAIRDVEFVMNSAPMGERERDQLREDVRRMHDLHDHWQH